MDPLSARPRRVACPGHCGGDFYCVACRMQLDRKARHRELDAARKTKKQDNKTGDVPAADVVAVPPAPINQAQPIPKTNSIPCAGTRWNMMFIPNASNSRLCSLCTKGAVGDQAKAIASRPDPNREADLLDHRLNRAAREGRHYWRHGNTRLMQKQRAEFEKSLQPKKKSAQEVLKENNALMRSTPTGKYARNDRNALERRLACSCIDMRSY